MCLCLCRSWGDLDNVVRKLEMWVKWRRGRAGLWVALR